MVRTSIGVHVLRRCIRAGVFVARVGPSRQRSSIISSVDVCKFAGFVEEVAPIGDPFFKGKQEEWGNENR